MLDLLIALSVQLAFAIALVRLAGRFSREHEEDIALGPPEQEMAPIAGTQPKHPILRTRNHRAEWLMSSAIVLALILLFYSKDHLFWARWIPSSAAIIWSNCSVFALSIAAGAAFHLPNRPRWRQWVSSFILLLLALLVWVQPVALPVVRPIQGGDNWGSGNVCLQSRSTTCSAAAAATLLRAHQVVATESQLVAWCLTDQSGTPSLGLWRGLCIALGESRLRPEVFRGSVEELIQRGPWPVILAVGVPADADPIYVERYGWDPNLRHSVVLFGRKAEGLLDIGDPSIGREVWSDEDLRVLWRGDAIALVPR